MVASKLTSKGQITIPKSVRDRMGLKSGDKLEWITKGDKVSFRRASLKENPFLKLLGMAQGSFKSRAEINAWIADLRDSD